MYATVRNLYTLQNQTQVQQVTTKPIALDVCLTTQLSLDRWPRLVEQAQAWGGPVSAAVYVPACKDTAQAAQYEQYLKDELVHRMPPPCKHLTISVLYANHTAREGSIVMPGAAPQQATQYDHLYPINSLRNLAIEASQSEVIFFCDCDLVPSEGLYAALSPSGVHDAWLRAQYSTTARDPPGINSRTMVEINMQPSTACTPMACSVHPSTSKAGIFSTPKHDATQAHNAADLQTPAVLMLPLFQLPVARLEATSTQKPKGATQQQGAEAGFGAALLQPSATGDGINQHQHAPRSQAELAVSGAVPFHCGVYPQAKPSLDQSAWWAATQPYCISYSDLFEVHGGVALRETLPLYDEGFKGYGLNKCQHAYHMASLGFSFQVLHDHFLVTKPHARSDAYRAVFGTAADPNHRRHIEQLYESFKQAHAS